MKRWILTAAVLMALLGSICGTYAYTTVSSKSHNVITSDGVEITVEEWQQTEAGWTPYPEEAVSVMPGRRVSKIVAIRNRERPCYVRACVEASVTDADGNTRVLQQERMEELLQWKVDEELWQKKDRKWWYYMQPLQEGAVTEPLFREITFSGEKMDNTYQGSTIRIHITAQAVQSQNNGESALLAVGWPEAQER